MWGHPDTARNFGQADLFLPTLASVPGYEQRRACLRTSRNVNDLRVGGIYRHGHDQAQRVRIRKDYFVGMIGIHFDAFDGGRIGINQVPLFPAICAAPQTRRIGVHGFRVLRIEYKKVYNAAKAEHAPGTAAIVSDVRAGHVAGNENCVRIKRADGWMEHGSAATRADDAEVSRALGEEAGTHYQAQHDENCGKDAEFHWLLFDVTARSCRGPLLAKGSINGRWERRCATRFR